MIIAITKKKDKSNTNKEMTINVTLNFPNWQLSFKQFVQS